MEDFTVYLTIAEAILALATTIGIITNRQPINYLVPIMLGLGNFGVLLFAEFGDYRMDGAINYLFPLAFVLVILGIVTAFQLKRRQGVI